MTSILTVEEIRRLDGEIVETWRRVVSQKLQQPLHALEVTLPCGTFMIPVPQIRKVVAMTWPQPLADSPDWVLGMLSCDSAEIPLIDLNLRLGGRPIESSSQKLFVVVVDQPCWLGLVVPAVGRVLKLEEETPTLTSTSIPRGAFMIGALHEGESQVAHLLSVVGLRHH
jgi:chemotaxis signal transduction protein